MKKDQSPFSKNPYTRDEWIKLTTCPICQKQKEIICQDHCHVTGLNRDLICNNCNVALGMFNDDCSIMGRAIAYVERWREAHKIEVLA